MKLLKKIPFFLFLLVVFFCLHGSVENYGYLEIKEVLLIGGVLFLSILLCYGILFMVTGNAVLASIVSFFMGLWYFFFGALHDWVKSVTRISFISSYSFLLPLLLIITVLLFIFLKRKKQIAIKLFFYLNVLLLIYSAIDTVLLITKIASPKSISTRTVPFDTNKVNAKPNVYFLMFDEYAGNKSLKDSFGFANDSLFNYLSKKQFKKLPVFSNYDFTLFSMSAILNMQYVDTGYNPGKVTQRDFQIRTNEIRNGEVFTIFKKMGYQVRNYSVFDIGETHSISRQNAFLPVHSVLLTDKILHNRIIRTSGWLFQTGKLALPSWRKKYLYQHETNNLYAQQMLIKSAGEKKTAPVFCYAHFMLPHWPYYRDSTGAHNSDEIIASSNLLHDKALYLSYLKYTNRVIEQLVDEIAGKDPGAI
ncbi:MAG TPA: hypothetical protein PKY28_09585, partial [Ferruginibacter sp.]|nr:hypothetical protein [Ferruginibacter sp.]